MTAAPVLARTLKYKVSVTNGATAGKNFNFDQALVKIGRGPENDLVFADDPKMSRMHAEIQCFLGQLIVRNVSNKNQILVNGERVEEKTISGTAIVQIGDTILQIQVDEKPEESENPKPAQQGRSPSPAHLVAVSQAPNAAHPAVAVGKAVPRPSETAMPSPVYQPSAPASPGYASAPSPQKSPRPSRRVGAQKQSNFQLYAIIVVIGIVGYWFLDGDTKSKRAEVNIRTEGDVARAIEDSAKAVQELRKQQQTSGQDSIQYRSAQEHYIKGFRDYRQGQYARAMQSFQAALSFYPAHELARKYLIQSQRKFEEQVDRHMSQGRKYYQKQNYKMCQSSFASVMIMLKDSAKPKYREAKQFYDECNLRSEGGY